MKKNKGDRDLPRDRAPHSRAGNKKPLSKTQGNQQGEQNHQHGDQKPRHGSMVQRGVSRPMAEKEIRKHQQKQQPQKEHERQGHQEHKHGMSHEQREMMLHMHYKQTLWIYWTIILLGVWMLLSPLTFSYGIGTVEPGGGREVWLSLESRIAVMKWSDIISGILLIFFGWRALTPDRPYSLWICCFVGIWLSMAPVLFWAPTAVAYLNNTMVGMLVISLTILIPGMPNMIKFMKMGSEVPPGWSYNPSSWPQRWIMIVLGFVGYVVSRYLAAFQLGYIDTAWDPFFGESTRQVLNSGMSHSLPVSDAALGTLAYTFEFLMGFMGSPSRWRTMPWMVAFFGILVIPLGLVHIFLVISQPIIVGAWCTFCLLAAAIMLPMIPLEVDEVVAMGQHMVQAKKRGDSLWKVFWKGGEPFEHNSDERSPKMMELPQKPAKVFMASIWGMSFPWTLVISTILGIGLVFAPALFGLSTQATPSDIFHLTGSLIVVVSVISMGEVIRIGRYGNILLGLTVAIAPWFFGDGQLWLNLCGTVAGLLVAALAIPRGAKTENYGLWDKYVK